MDRRDGLLIGGGGTYFKGPRRPKPSKVRVRSFPNLRLSNHTEIKQLPDFDPKLEFEYSRRELTLLAEKILLEDSRPMDADPMWLHEPAWRNRVRREIYTASGTPEPHIVQGMYWRTHPEGRKVCEDRGEDKRRSFYI